MNEKSSVLRRMVDICFAIKVASDNGQWLSKVQLQKFIYLLDVLKPIRQIMPPLEGHLTYKYGPYDVMIQNSADVLAFRGILSIHKIRFKQGTHIGLSYALTSSGENIVNKFASDENFISCWELSKQIGYWLNKLGWERIKSLVYAEPTYISIRRKGYGQRIIPYDATQNSAAYTMEIIEYALLFGLEKSSISEDLMIKLFFNYLDSAEKIYKEQIANNQEET